MAPLSLRIVQDCGAVTRKVKIEASLTVAEATKIVHEKANLPPDAKAYGLFLRSLDSNLSGIWLEDDKKLSDYLLRDGDQLDYMSKIRNLRLRMLDDTVKTFQVDQSKVVSDLMLSICSKIGITNHEEYGLCVDQMDEAEECKEKPAAPHTGTLTLKKKSKLEERDIEFEQLSKKLKTDDNVNWIDSHKTLSEACISPTQTLLLKRRLFYSDRNVDSRDPVQLNLLYNQARDNILNSRHPITEEKDTFDTVGTVARPIETISHSDSDDDSEVMVMGYIKPQRERTRRTAQDFRRTIYRHNLWARPLPDFTGRFRDCSPDFFRYNSSQVHQLVPWLSRELFYLLNKNEAHVTYVLGRILELLPLHPILSAEFRAELRRFLADRTDHFLHELHCFASTPYNLTGYDRHVQYQTESRLPDPAGVSQVLSSEDEDSHVSDIVMVSSSRAATPPPAPPRAPAPPLAPSVVPIETISDSDDDSEVMVVGYIKPQRERTRRTAQGFRRTVYRHNLWARPLPDFTGRFRDCSPDFFRYNSSQVHRLVPWLSRELFYLLNKNEAHVTYVLGRILELLPLHPILSAEFRAELRRFLADRTDHFLHELHCFASTPYDLTGYDRHVQYQTESRLPDPAGVSQVLSSEDEDSHVSDIVMVSSSRAATPPPAPPRAPAPPLAPSVVPIETISDSDDDSEVMVVGYIKPQRERTRRTAQGFRRTVYRHNLWARPLPDFTGRFRDCSPDFFRYNSSQVHRLVPWLSRELFYLLNKNEAHVTYVLGRILELLPLHPILSAEFRAELRRFLADRTDHFLHELHCFASTPYDLTGYDRHEIRQKCDAIESKANKLLNGEVACDLDFSDLFDQFGKECDDSIKHMIADVKGMEDAKTKKMLQSKVMALSESCNMLRFATKSGISTEACCTLDASLDELDDIESRVIKSIVPDPTASGVTLRSRKKSSSGHSPATINLCREVTSSPAGVEASTVTAYIADAHSRCDASNPEENNKLLKHLYKLVHLLKTLTVTSSKRAATWQPVDGPEIAYITEQILQEINNPESKFGVKPEEATQKILDEDIVKLLIPSAPKILGDKKQQEDKLTQTAAQLSETCGNLSYAVSRDSSQNLSHLSRVAVAQAKELDGIARGADIKDPVQKRKVDEAAKEMSFATYNVLKTAESSCLEPKNSNLRRRLADALGNLNHSIDKLVWHTSSAPVLQRQCGALSRSTAAQLAALQPRAHSAAPFNDTCDLLVTQSEQILKLKNDQPMPRKEFMSTLDDIGTAVRTSVDCAAQCAYYIAISDLNKDIAKSGLVDVPQIQKAIESIQDSCMAIIGSSQIEQAKEQKEDLAKRVSDFSTALDKAQIQVKDGEVKRTLNRARSCISEAADDLESNLENNGDMEKVTPKAVNLLEAVNTAYSLIEKCPLVPIVGDMTTDTKAKCDEVMNHSKTLLSNTLALLKDVNSAPEEPEMMTWVTYSTNRKKLLDAYNALLKTVRRNGHRVGIYEQAPEEEEKEQVKKSYIEIQVDLANKWLKSSVCKNEVKVVGQQAARNVVDMARQMSEDLKTGEREEVRSVITETEELLSECSKKYDHEKNSVLMDRLKDLRKSIQRGVVTRVVEDFIEAEAPLEDLDLLADIEKDESKRKFILERKIASLLAQLGRVTKTARFVANASQQQTLNVELTQCSEQTELLAPMLVKAAQQRIDHPDDKTVIENYKALLAQYAESISKVRDLCDRAVDPMDFVQTAGDTMQRMREDMTQHNTDPQKCAHASSAITKLANRVINVSMSSNAVASDPELQKSLIEAKKRLHAVTPAPNTRASRLPDWRDTTAEILRTTGEVESALGGENIFKKEPTTANQPIYNVARSLHESVREWSSRDNEIVGVARRMAVLMARLSEYMETDKKDALLQTSKSIVAESHEVAELAKKLAHECSDVRIKTNLLQTCERIPTISGQLKMLTTVKGSSLGQQGSEADKEAMDMLVGNAQSLMMSISDVVKAAASASVKIMSQRGPRLRWVRKNYY